MMIRKTLLLIAILACFGSAAPCFAGCSGGSPTWTSATAAASDVQACISAASSGDTILVPAGTVSFGGAVDIPSSKCLTINGQGLVIITSSPGFTLEPSGSCESRITGFTFTGSSSNPPNTDLNVTSNTSSSAYRIDHNTFTNSSQSVFLAVSGNGPGLIDHNTFTGGPASEDIHNLGMGAGNEAGWQDNIVPGGPQMVFVEDNTFNDVSTGVINSGIESYYGARTVLRHNIFNFTQIDQHGTPGNVGARWWEAYDNTFNNLGQNQCCYITMRGGTGVIWGNVAVGNNQGAGSIDLYYEESGTWPQSWQPGSGINGDTTPHNACGSLNSAPAYVWGNSSNMPVSSQTPSLVELNRDYFSSSTQPASMSWEESSSDTCSTKYNYAPYTYPHPLQGGQSTTVAAPTGLTATVQQ
jgi:hypothetical protein